MDWFLYDNSLGHERVNLIHRICFVILTICEDLT